MNRNIVLSLGLAAMLAACGKAGSLERTDGMGPQPVAYGAQRPESSSALTRPSTQAVPGRSSALINSAERRDADPFDVPPGAASVSFPGDPLTADFEDEGEERVTELDDDGA